MSEFKILIEVIGDRLNIRHTIEKRDTEELSKFQALGLLYHMIDSVTQLNAGLEHSAVVVAREIFGREGWEDEVIELLLAAQTWEDRMTAAWNAVDEDARKAALSLDYQSFQNYWPSLDFCQPGWDVAVKSKLCLCGSPRKPDRHRNYITLVNLEPVSLNEAVGHHWRLG